MLVGKSLYSRIIYVWPNVAELNDHLYVGFWSIFGKCVMTIILFIYWYLQSRLAEIGEGVHWSVEGRFCHTCGCLAVNFFGDKVFTKNTKVLNHSGNILFFRSFWKMKKLLNVHHEIIFCWFSENFLIHRLQKSYSIHFFLCEWLWRPKAAHCLSCVYMNTGY
jgi:hypothetical protein